MMPPEVTLAEPWMDLEEAAAYSCCSVFELLGAVGRRELPAITSHHLRLGEWMVRARDVEAWSERRASELTALSRSA